MNPSEQTPFRVDLQWQVGFRLVGSVLALVQRHHGLGHEVRVVQGLRDRVEVRRGRGVVGRVFHEEVLDSLELGVGKDFLKVLAEGLVCKGLRQLGC